MKIKCLKQDLLNAVSYANRVTGKNLQLSVLNYILISAQKKELTIKATNLDIGVEVNIPAAIEEDGIVAVSGNVLYNFISNLQEDDIKIEKNGENIKIQGKKSSSILKTHPYDDFPSIPKVENGVEIKLKSEDFLSGVRSVWYSASNSTIKPELSSIYIYQNGQKILFVATDSFRLGEKSIHNKNEKEFNPILIPVKNIPEIVKILESEGGSVDINIGKNQISFSTDRVYISSRLTEGNFPDYKQIIPKEFGTEIIVLKEDLMNVMRATNVFLDKFNQVNFKVDKEKKSVVVSSKNTEVGENKNEIDTTINGENIEINFNHKYIMDCFQSINSDSLSLSFSGAGKPMVIQGVSDESFRYLVMPMSR